MELGPGQRVTRERQRTESPSHMEPLPGLESFADRSCSICKMWMANPLQDLQSTKYHSINCSMERWDSGNEIGCILCQIVSLTVERYIESRKHLRIETIVMNVKLNWDSLPPSLTLNIDCSECNMDCGRKLELYGTMETQDPFPDLPLRRELPLSFRSTECLDLVKDWLTQCRNLHDNQDCLFSTPARLPTRILDISSHTTRLVLSNDQCGCYAALSHCWGSATSGMPPKTVRSNIQMHLSTGIPRESLSQSFNDAIAVAKHLGYRYLWIDSLCIIQEDDEDWKRESGRMADVYGNADLVLAATSAADSSPGFLGVRPDSFSGTIHLKGPQESCHAPYTVHYRSSLPHDGDSQYKSFPESWRPAWEGPLEKRAWAYQERLMARRYVSFGSSEVCWECAATLECECCSTQSIYDKSGTLIIKNQILAPTKYNLSRKIKMAQDLPPSLMGSELRSEWRNVIVPAYSERKLSRISDRLVALSASAAKFSEKLTDQYLAGIWSEDLLEGGLIWSRIEQDTGVVNEVPSWSWASIASSIRHWYDSDLQEGGNWKHLPKLVSVDYAAPPENRFGSPLRASITLRGGIVHDVKVTYEMLDGRISHQSVMYRSKWHDKSGISQNDEHELRRLTLDTELEPIKISEERNTPIISARRKRSDATDSMTQRNDGQAQVFGRLFLLSLTKHWALILGLVAVNPKRYERLGLLELYGTEVIMDDWVEKEVTLI